jgi:plasmid stabilization system protein ParE
MLRVLWTPPAERDLRRLASKVQQRIVDALDRFATTRAGNVCRRTSTTPRIGRRSERQLFERVDALRTTWPRAPTLGKPCRTLG